MEVVPGASVSGKAVEKPVPENLVAELLRRGIMIEPKALELIKKSPHVLGAINLDEIKMMLTLSDLEEGAQISKVDEGYRILYKYEEKFDQKGSVEDFINYFSSRYDKISTILRNRPEMKLVSMNKLLRQQGREEVSLIGMVYSKKETKMGHVMLEVEDETGRTNVLVGKNSQVFKKTDEIVEDEIISIKGQTGRNIVFAQDITFPDIQQTDWPKNAKSVAVFISDTHVGSNKFLESTFLKFTDWLRNGEDETVRRTKYLFIAGDLVDGIGVYKGQQKELTISDVKQQYEKFDSLLDLIPKEMVIFVCPGNHDATRESEPQPAIPREFAAPLYERRNVVMVSSPSYINVEGVSVLMYHGTSLDSVIDSIPSLRRTGYDKPEEAMKYFLKKRHLMPSYSEKTKIFPDSEDQLVIEKVPNVVHCGHVHSLGYTKYKEVRLINSSTFQGQTSFQLKVGHHPTPGKVPYIDLADGSIGIKEFQVAG